MTRALVPSASSATPAVSTTRPDEGAAEVIVLHPDAAGALGQAPVPYFPAGEATHRLLSRSRSRTASMRCRSADSDHHTLRSTHLPTACRRGSGSSCETRPRRAPLVGIRGSEAQMRADKSERLVH